LKDSMRRSSPTPIAHAVATTTNAVITAPNILTTTTLVNLRVYLSFFFEKSGLLNFFQ